MYFYLLNFSHVALPASSRPASYTVYWAVICLQPLTRAVTRAAPRSFTYGEAAVVCQGILLLVASLVLQLVALPVWSVRTVLLGLGGWVEATVTVLQDQSATVTGLVAFWSVLGLASVAVVPLYRLLAWRVTTATRKIFHLSVLLVFTSGLALCPLLLSLASVLAVLGLTSLELLRVSRILPALSSSLTHHLAPFLDSKDPGPLILTPLYLLVGVSWPLWLWPAPLPLPLAPLPLYSGLVSVAVLDSAASVLGSTFGSLRWNSSSSRTVEGSLAGWLAAMAYIYLLDMLGLTSVSSWPGLGLVVAALAMAEAACSQVDNLVLPLAMYVMLLVLQHLS